MHATPTDAPETAAPRRVTGPSAQAPAPRPCPVCDAATGASESPAYAACGACGARVSLVPEGSYDADYYYHGPEFDRRCRARAAVQVRHLRRLRRAMGSAAPDGGPLRVLELGCAKGFFVEAALAAGYDARGVDLAEGAVAEGRRRGLEGHLFTADARGELPAGCGSEFDLVVAWELLEHMDRPASFLATAAKHLRPGGWVTGSTPNGDSSWLRLLGRTWHGFDIPQFHRVYLGPESFATAAEDAGLAEPLTLSATEPAGDFLVKNLATGLARRWFGSDSRPLRTALAAGLALPALCAERLAGHLPALAGDTLLFAAQQPSEVPRSPIAS
ncbi:class I SAM-dependent methyltransferase [Engelhardtia mirabilis]|uniref:Ubiquinone biosynthesis O-methyltransferase n=1 Tax=Engelhardtia mirabilis TaxID=2528011 RepID=A0A518BJK2_9BACT|nr:Ubiquinone biosynthesis O-methyltransferase [Planctomycetes bacterium Pla133]QDV01462.1 Ubiquinone biosynthesis O-methyltransferase [Planctomycetes bacterium Pla86]